MGSILPRRIERSRLTTAAWVEEALSPLTCAWPFAFPAGWVRATMSFRISRRRLAALAVACVVTCGFLTKAYSQTPSAKSKPTQEHRLPAKTMSPTVYEDDEVKIPIPAGWVRSTRAHPAVGPYKIHGQIAAGSAVLQAKGRLLLEKNGYILALAYHTEHASGIRGGRFIEMLRIPWLDPDQAWTCSLHFRTIPQPASRTLMFMNLTFESGFSRVRESCGFEKNLGYWTNVGGRKRYVGERRWFAGYFTTSDRGWFFQSDGVDCGEKAYTLSSEAETPDELPVVGNRILVEIIEEAIDIVDSIQYKRCAPTTAP
jgi:hypothetical protein